MATRKKASKRSKTATKRKKVAKPKSAKSATAQSKAKSKAKVKAKTAKRKAASGRNASKKKTTKASGKKKGKSTKATKSAKKTAVSKSAEVAEKRRGRGAMAKSRSSALKVAYTAPPPEEKPLPKTRLNAKQLAEFKGKLLEKRRMLTGDVRNLTLDALKRDGSGELSNMPIHMADIGSDNWEQEFTLGLIENEQQLVREIDDALARIVDRTYGVCIATGQHIGIARLRAKPWAKYCIEYARQLELGRR